MYISYSPYSKSIVVFLKIRGKQKHKTPSSKAQKRHLHNSVGLLVHLFETLLTKSTGKIDLNIWKLCHFSLTHK